MQPHLGNLIGKTIKEKGLSYSEVARRIGITPQAFQNCLKQPSTQVANLCKLSIALNYNFFADIMESLPPETQNSNHSPAQKTILNQQQEITDLNKQIAIYKEILLAK